MIENKKEMFAFGLGVFLEQTCGNNQLHYTNGMVHQGGYLAACKEFYKVSGYLTKEDRDALFTNDVVPTWMSEIFIQFEQQTFGTSIWDKQ